MESQFQNPYEAIDVYTREYRRLIFLLLEIDKLDTYVKSLCKNYQIAAKKLLGEQDAKLQ
jgi:hypothetical protein